MFFGYSSHFLTFDPPFLGEFISICQRVFCFAEVEWTANSESDVMEGEWWGQIKALSLKLRKFAGLSTKFRIKKKQRRFSWNIWIYCLIKYMSVVIITESEYNCHPGPGRQHFKYSILT